MLVEEPVRVTEELNFDYASLMAFVPIITCVGLAAIERFGEARVIPDWFKTSGSLRNELIVSAASCIVGALITTLAPGFAIMVIGHFIHGDACCSSVHFLDRCKSDTRPVDIRVFHCDGNNCCAFQRLIIKNNILDPKSEVEVGQTIIYVHTQESARMLRGALEVSDFTLRTLDAVDTQEKR
ncbi:hypothetical protein Tco_0776688 [Tanacetum coccineum]